MKSGASSPAVPLSGILGLFFNVICKVNGVFFGTEIKRRAENARKVGRAIRDWAPNLSGILFHLYTIHFHPIPHERLNQIFMFGTPEGNRGPTFLGTTS